MPPNCPRVKGATNLEVRMVSIGKGGVHLVHRHRVHARHLVLLLPLHPSVLEPDLYLPLGQAERVRYLDPDQVDVTLLRCVSDISDLQNIFRLFLDWWITCVCV